MKHKFRKWECYLNVFPFCSTSYGYSDIVTIPIGATNIDIKQRSHRGIKHDGNYLAVKRENGAYILNGNFSVSTVEQDIPILGAVLKYSGSSTTLERIQSFRQLKEAITIQVLATGGDANPPKIKYTFFIPKDIAFNKSKEKKGLYLSLHMISDISDWVLGEWSECSKSCGSGWSRRSIECRDSDGFFSSQCDRELKPTDIRPCGDAPCPIWQMGPWSACSRTCGQGERRRSVFCIDYKGKTVEQEMCDPNKIPEPASGQCNNHDCSWKTWLQWTVFIFILFDFFWSECTYKSWMGAKVADILEQTAIDIGDYQEIQEDLDSTF